MIFPFKTISQSPFTAVMYVRICVSSSTFQIRMGDIIRIDLKWNGAVFFLFETILICSIQKSVGAMRNPMVALEFRLFDSNYNCGLPFVCSI